MKMVFSTLLIALFAHTGFAGVGDKLTPSPKDKNTINKIIWDIRIIYVINDIEQSITIEAVGTHKEYKY